MDIKPGATVSIIVDIDYRKEIVETKNSIVHDVEGDRITIAQPDPPISRTHIDKEVYLTYLDRSQNEPVRYGFPVRIAEFIKDYVLSGETRTQAIVLFRRGRTEPHNLRMFFRLEPPGNSGIEIFIHGKKVNILDISIGGAKFSHSKVYPFKLDEEVEVLLIIGERPYQVNARVINMREPENEKMQRILEIVSIQFLSMDGLVKNALGRKIRDIERAIRFKEIDGRNP